MHIANKVIVNDAIEDVLSEVRRELGDFDVAKKRCDRIAAEYREAGNVAGFTRAMNLKDAIGRMQELKRDIEGMAGMLKAH